MSQHVEASMGVNGRRNYRIPNVTQAQFRELEDAIKKYASSVDGTLDASAVATLRVFSSEGAGALDARVGCTVRDLLGDYVVVTR